MSRKNVEVVRKPLRADEAPSRTLDQRLVLCCPRAAAATRRLIAKLPPGSPLRQAAVWHAYRRAVEAHNRRDLDFVMRGFHLDAEYHPYREVVEAGLAEPCYRGPSGYRTFVSIYEEVWGVEFRLEPSELIDLGDRTVLLADMPTHAIGAGVRTTRKYASVSTLKDGLVIRQHDFLDHAEALEAVGMRE